MIVNEWKNYIIKNIIYSLENRVYRLEELLNNFLEKDFTEKSKEKVLELLYLFKVYKDGYISQDPRFKGKLENEAINQTLEAKNQTDLNEGIKKLEELVELLKEAETNPIATAKKIESDRKKYEGVIF